jgi:rSAM/selenodomain-associated transferase 1
VKPSTAIIVFARAPQLGRVKTRLIPALGEQGALDLYRAMLWHALKIAHQWRADELILACTPSADHPQLKAMGKAVQATLQVQCGADIGERMHHALLTALARHQIALLIGSDCPSLCRADLDEARARLVLGDNTVGVLGRKDLVGASATSLPQMVFIPASDGGYVLVGSTDPCVEIFQQMPWGTSEVMNVTRRRLREKSINWQELQPHTDIDRAADLVNLPVHLRLRFCVAPKF